jgi:hypothetical protein
MAYPPREPEKNTGLNVRETIRPDETERKVLHSDIDPSTSTSLSTPPPHPPPPKADLFFVKNNLARANGQNEVAKDW